MAYPFRNSIEAKEWLRGFCVRNELTWGQLCEMMDSTTPWRAKHGQWIPFASKLLDNETLAGVSKPKATQKTLQPALGPMLALLNRFTSEAEARDYFATLLFDEIVAIATAVKEKRGSRGKRVQRKTQSTSEQQSSTDKQV